MKNIKNIAKESCNLKQLGKIIFYEIVFVFLLYVMYQVFVFQVTTFARNVDIPSIRTSIVTQAAGEVSQNLAALKTMYAQFIFAGILLVVTVVVIYTVFNVFIWGAIKNKKLTTEFIQDFFKYSFPWNLAWTAVAVSTVFLYEPDLIATPLITIIVVGILLTTCWHLALVSKKPVGRAFKKILSKGHYLLAIFVPGLFFTLLLINGANAIYPNLLISLALLIICTAWLRLFSYKFIKEYEGIK